MIKKIGLPVLAGLLMSACSAAKKAGSTTVADTFPYPNIKIQEAKPIDYIGPCEPTICISPVNPDIVVAGSVLDNYYYSRDGGRTWTVKTLTSDYGVFGDPVLVADAQGNFYFSHLSDVEGKGWSGSRLLDRIVVQKSADGGKTFNKGSYMGENHPKDQDKQWMGVDPNSGALYCTWTEFDKYDSRDTARDKTRILFSKSIDGAQTWSPALKINQFDGDCLDDDNTVEGAVPVVGPKGEIYVAWAWNKKIWFDRSTDGGKTWLQKDIVVADQPGGWSMDIYGISRSNGLPFTDCDRSESPYKGSIYVNWVDQRNGVNNPDVFTAYSRDGGQSWSQPVRVNNDSTQRAQFLSAMTVDQSNGYVYCVFYDRREYRDKRTDVWLAVSKDGGQTYENKKISETPFDPDHNTFFGDYNHISAVKGVVRPIWTRLDGRVLSVWTAIVGP